MNINFEYHNVTASERLEILAAQKLTKLEGKYDFMINADVYFKRENTSNDTSGKICSIRVNTPGPTLFAECSSGAFEASIAKVITELKSQLQKRKDKMQMH
ncbi:putative sigma-54 modulation protein [Ulvibacter sp. MAR_2010_11]|uniref:ribosome hibernation-promoting factor, HPF/YfiA family n=1 Tax=Ulvibacter sp. MAR_2010_11 TaxID=1250229 RepID=UPI000C2B88C6|nr:ribosome-associated translation inhibitor RaiA [Ulvibacter sp. MAR_2010_11]PKA84187.1 putative sigma-54 modulation protein [Ulvibacter sp. MAR_2010_11]